MGMADEAEGASVGCAVGSRDDGTGEREDVAYINRVIAEECAGVFRCFWTQAKGRILVANRPFRRGELMLRQSPLLKLDAVLEEGEAAEALRRLRGRSPRELALEPHWYWLALGSTTKDQRGAAGELSGLPPTVPAEVQRRLLLLHGGQPGDGPEGKLCTSALTNELKLGRVQPSVLERLVRAWTLNCFEHSELTRTYATYFVPSFLSHSCQPSAVWALGEDGDFMLRARCDIAVGEEVTISYLSEDGLLDMAPARQRHLLKSKQFWCQCPRCLPGALDLSRGFRCPVAECGGAVFCRVLPRRPKTCVAKPRKLARRRPGKRQLKKAAPAIDKAALLEDVSALEGSTCQVVAALAKSSFGVPHLQEAKACGCRLTAAQAAALLQAERRLRKRLRQWEQESPRGTLELEAVERLEKWVERRFAQHTLVDRAYGHLVAVCLGLGRRGDAERLMERRAAFQRAAYPGTGGAHAWTMEAYAQMILSNRGIKVGKLLKQPRSLAASQPLLNDAVAEEAAKTVTPLFAGALEILRVLFGGEHEYYTEVEQTALALQTALESVAPGAAATAATALRGAGMRC